MPLLESAAVGAVAVLASYTITFIATVYSAKRVKEKLWKAAQTGDCGAIEEALRIKGVGIINARNHQYQSTALHHAIENGRWDVALFLLDVPGIDFEAEDKFGRTPLSLSVSKGKLALVQKLHSLGVNLERKQPHLGVTALDIAAEKGHHDLVRFLLVDCKCDPNTTDADGLTPLHKACYRRHRSIVSLLLDHRANIHANETADGTTPLHKAVLPLFGLEQWGWFTVWGDELDTVQDLLDRGDVSIIYARDKFGRTPLDLATNESIVNQLLTAHRDKVLALEGRLVAAHAILRNASYEQEQIITKVGTLSIEQFEFLLQPCLGRILSRVRDSRGMIPLHIAAARRAPSKVLRILMFRDACRFVDNSGALPIHHACKAASPLEAIRYLLETGGVETIRKRDHGGCLPLHLLLKGKSGDEEVVEKSDEEETDEDELGGDESGAEILAEKELNKVTLATVMYLVDAFPDSISTRTLDGDLPLTLAGASAPLKVINFLMRRHPSITNLENA